jgi:hypothetical protein
VVVVLRTLSSFYEEDFEEGSVVSVSDGTVMSQ